jgi:REP-associated tyrosine transposase
MIINIRLYKKSLLNTA